LPRYEVEICRTGYGFHTILVEANSQDEAIDKALDGAGNHYYDEKDAEYEIEDIMEVE